MRAFSKAIHSHSMFHRPFLDMPDPFPSFCPTPPPSTPNSLLMTGIRRPSAPLRTGCCFGIWLNHVLSQIRDVVDEIARDVIEKHCHFAFNFVTKLSPTAESFDNDKTYVLPDENFITVCVERFRFTEVLFFAIRIQRDPQHFFPCMPMSCCQWHVRVS